MNKLLRSGMRRYVHSIVFWLAIAVTVATAIVCGYNARDLYFDDVYIIIELAATAAMVSWLVGREYGEGIFRNKVVSGHSKGRVFMSELIMGVGACVGMYLIFVAIFLCFNSYIIGAVPVAPAMKIFVSCLLANACIAAIFVTVSCLIPQRAIVAIVNILLVFAMSFAGYSLQKQLNQPEFISEYDFKEVSYVDSAGDVHVEFEPDWDTERLVENKRYVDSPLREIYGVVNNILPYSHVIDAESFTSNWFGYNDYFGGESTWENSANLDVPSENNQELNSNLIYSAIVFLFVSCIGYICFRRKDLK